MTTYKNNERSFVIPTLAGFLLGAGFALLLTPRSGRQLRGDLHRGTRKAKNTVEETVELVKEQGKEVIEAAEEAIQEAKQAFEAGRTQVKQAMKDTKSKLE